MHLMLVLDQRGHPPVSVSPGGHVAGEVPQGAVQDPGGLQVRGVRQVVRALRVVLDPPAIRGFKKKETKGRAGHGPT